MKATEDVNPVEQIKNAMLEVFADVELLRKYHFEPNETYTLAEVAMFIREVESVCNATSESAADEKERVAKLERQVEFSEKYRHEFIKWLGMGDAHWGDILVVVSQRYRSLKITLERCRAVVSGYERPSEKNLEWLDVAINSKP
jgi:hypothetical protein